MQQGETEEGEEMTGNTLLALTSLILLFLVMAQNRTINKLWDVANKHETAICELLKLHPELLEEDDDDSRPNN